MSRTSRGATTASTTFYSYDANGNVTSLTDTNGSNVATYVYGPFGGTISSSGTLADENPFRFSTKYTDDETGLLNYGYRYYSPELGRWVNRDPIDENGGLNLYAFVGNSPVLAADILGLSSYQYHNFASYGMMSAQVKPSIKYGADRAIKIDFTLKPSLHCECNKIDFTQAYIVRNLEGPETMWAENSSMPSWTDHNTVVPDHPSGAYYIQSLYDAVGPIAAIYGQFVTPFYSWFEDSPGASMTLPIPERYRSVRYWEDATGAAVMRKVRLTFLTCAVCSEADWWQALIGEPRLGCVSWKLDYPNLQPGTLPVISIVGFYPPPTATP
ncbi:MAG: RHS repeat-associated core domain-containing protein [Candidatus Pacebacteria bacterium]|nr:RHS repeat-associated core domain-containing protein [Candidatus Paceibacterota bacterium]